MAYFAQPSDWKTLWPQNWKLWKKKPAKYTRSIRTLASTIASSGVKIRQSSLGWNIANSHAQNV